MTIRHWMKLIALAAWICAVVLTPARPIIVVATVGSVLGIICVRQPWFVFVMYLYLAAVPWASDSSANELFFDTCLIGSTIGAVVGLVLQRWRRPEQRRRRRPPRSPVFDARARLDPGKTSPSETTRWHPPSPRPASGPPSSSAGPAARSPCAPPTPVWPSICSEFADSRPAAQSSLTTPSPASAPSKTAWPSRKALDRLEGDDVPNKENCP